MRLCAVCQLCLPRCCVTSFCNHFAHLSSNTLPFLSLLCVTLSARARKIEVLSFVVGILVVSIVWLLSSRGKQGTEGQGEALPKRDVRENDVTIRELNGSNFPNWEYTLRLALRRLRAEAALDRQYPVNSQANQVALNKIAGSVDDRHLTMIRGMDSACDAFETISREYTLNDAVKQALLERDIRDVSLEGFEEKQVNEYIAKIDKLVDDLKMAGALLTSERELCL